MNRVWAFSRQEQEQRTLATRVYLQAARAIAAVLARKKIVETIFVRRSVASGEVVFGRSDIDLSIVIRDPASGAALCSLANSFRALHFPFPMLGQAQCGRSAIRWSGVLVCHRSGPRQCW